MPGVKFSQMAPKGKKVTMSLNDFLNTDKRKNVSKLLLVYFWFSFLCICIFLVKEIGGDESWADEGFSLPSARNFILEALYFKLFKL